MAKSKTQASSRATGLISQPGRATYLHTCFARRRCLQSALTVHFARRNPVGRECRIASLVSRTFKTQSSRSRYIKYNKRTRFSSVMLVVMQAEARPPRGLRSVRRPQRFEGRGRDERDAYAFALHVQECEPRWCVVCDVWCLP